MNVMQMIGLGKVTLNIGVGEPGDKLQNAVKLLGDLTGRKAVETKTKRRIPTWKIRPGLAIGAKVTIRGKKAEELLRKLLKANEDKIPAKKFDNFGNFSFGIKEYLDIPGAKYDAKIGIIGLEVAVTLKKPGYRIKEKQNKSSIGKKQKITIKEAIEYMKKEYGVVIE